MVFFYAPTNCTENKQEIDAINKEITTKEKLTSKVSQKRHLSDYMVVMRSS